MLPFLWPNSLPKSKTVLFKVRKSESESLRTVNLDDGEILGWQTSIRHNDASQPVPMADITNGSLQPSSLIHCVTLLQHDFQDRFYQLLEKRYTRFALFCYSWCTSLDLISQMLSLTTTKVKYFTPDDSLWEVRSWQLNLSRPSLNTMLLSIPTFILSSLSRKTTRIKHLLQKMHVLEKRRCFLSWLYTEVRVWLHTPTFFSF